MNPSPTRAEIAAAVDTLDGAVSGFCFERIPLEKLKSARTALDTMIEALFARAEAAEAMVEVSIVGDIPKSEPNLLPSTVHRY